MKINDLKWEIRYVEGSINDLDKNHIAHAPNDQSLQERRAELVNELAALNAQLAELLPTEIQNANNVEPDTNELSDQEVAEIKRRSQINAIKSRIATYERAIERQYDQQLENSLIATKAQLIAAKAQLAEIEPNTTPQVDPIIQERETARNEYDQLNAVRKVIEKDCERFERLRDRCKSGSTKRREYYQLLESFKPIIRAFGEKFIAAQDRYNKSLTLRTDEERAATQKAIDEHNADLDARGIKYFATVYYYPNGIEGEDMSTFEKECTSFEQAAAFVSQEDHDGVYVGGIYDAGWEITDRNHNLIADHTTGLKEENTMTIKDQADFYADKVKRESKPLDNENVFDLLPTLDQLNDVDDEIVTPVENRHKLIGKWNETLFDPEFKHGTAKMIFTMQGRKHQAKIVWSYISIGFDKGKYKFRMGTLLLGKYDTPAQVEKVIDLLKAAITRGDKEFTFPTVEELIDPPELPTAKPRTLRNSINRAIKQCIRNRIGYLKSHNSKMEKYEYELLCLLQGARRELEVA